MEKQFTVQMDNGDVLDLTRLELAHFIKVFRDELLDPNKEPINLLLTIKIH